MLGNWSQIRVKLCLEQGMLVKVIELGKASQFFHDVGGFCTEYTCCCHLFNVAASNALPFLLQRGGFGRGRGQPPQ